MKQVFDIELILLNEVDNKRYVYLYLEGETWCAYERSAYYLAVMNFPVSLDIEVVHDGYEVVLMKASFNIAQMRLPLCRSAVLRTVADDRLLFQLDKLIDGFVKWKRLQIGTKPA